MTQVPRVRTAVTDDNFQSLPAIEPDFSNNQILTNDATPQATANPVGSQLVRISTLVDVHISFDTAPIATVSDMILQAGNTEYFKIDPTHKVSTISPAGQSGDTHITPALEVS